MRHPLCGPALLGGLLLALAAARAGGQDKPAEVPFDPRPPAPGPKQAEREDELVKAVKAWDRPWLRSATSLATLPGPEQLALVAFAVDGSRLAALGSDRLRVYDLTAGRLALDVPVPRHNGVTNRQGEPLGWSADGAWLATPGENKVVVRLRRARRADHRARQVRRR